MSKTVIVLVAMILSFGCDPRSVPAEQTDASAATDSQGSARKDSHVNPAIDAGQQPSPECVIAVRMDVCCASPAPALLTAVQQDPCLTLWPINKYNEECPPTPCPAMVCEDVQPLTRLVGPDSSGAQCHWVSECESTSDCMEAIDARMCCDCYQAYPWALLEKEPCLHPMVMSSWPPPGCDDVCGGTGGPWGGSDIMCEECPPSNSMRCESVVPRVNRCGPSR